MTSIQMLTEILNSIYEMQLDMIKLAKRKKQVLIDGNIEELSEIMKKESTWISKLKQIDFEREKMTNIVIDENKIVSNDLRISEILSQLEPSEQKEKLAITADRLIKILDEIKLGNETNAQLIRQSLQYITHSFKSLTQESEQNMTYSKPTNRQSNTTSIGIYDQKV